MSVTILVFGDSFANFRRFDAGIIDECRNVGIQADVLSVSRPGFTSKKLARALRNDKPLARELASRRDVRAAMVVAGVNDVIVRRGAHRYSASMLDLQDAIRSFAPIVFVLDIVPFDENADLSGFAGKVRNRVSQRFFDRKPGRVERYRDALRLRGFSQRVDVASWMPEYDAARFKDRIHLTQAAFADLARHAGAQIACTLHSRSMRPLVQGLGT